MLRGRSHIRKSFGSSFLILRRCGISTTSEIRESFLNYFEKEGHRRVTSAPVRFYHLLSLTLSLSSHRLSHFTYYHILHILHHTHTLTSPHIITYLIHITYIHTYYHTSHSRHIHTRRSYPKTMPHCSSRPLEWSRSRRCFLGTRNESTIVRRRHRDV